MTMAGWLGVGVAMLVAWQNADAGQMYRWVDKDGRVHFSDQPPPTGVKQSEQLALPATPQPFNEATTTAADSAAERAAKLRQSADGMQADRQARQQQKAEAAADKAKREQACARAKAELSKFDTANLKFMVDENNERRAMSDSEFRMVESELRQRVEKACG